MKIARTFFSIFVGWCVAIVALVCWQVFAPGFGYVTDFTFFLYWPALFGFIGWLVFVVPAVLCVSEDNRFMQLPVILITGAVYGVLIYLLLVCTWLASGWKLAWFPAVMGGVGGGVYSLLGRSKTFRRHHTVTTVGFFAAPVALLALFSFFLWPFVTAHIPYVAYVFGANQSRDDAHLQILKSIRTGDTYADLHRRYPRIFIEPFLSRSGGGADYTYSISFDETRTYVTEITIGDRP